jgi:hypothetical protein
VSYPQDNLRTVLDALVAMGSVTPLPYWQVNVPPSEQSNTCPPFLQNLSAKDIGILSTPDSSYQILSWPSVQRIISLNRIDLFQRIPSDLRRYLAYIQKIKKSHGSIMNFMLKQRLHWALPIKAEGGLFEKDGDIRILKNDWPYGIDERIVHLVVWTKFELEDDPATDDLTDEARAAIQKYVDQRFGQRVGNDNVRLIVILPGRN